MMQSEFHQWEPDFSEGEPDPREPTCGVCGRADDLYHFKRPEFKKKNLSD
jgi:hypothetical protein